jgi:hypothetical protein
MNKTLKIEPCKKGSKGISVRNVQEWLCLHGFGLVIDRDFGVATEAQVKAFQKKKGINPTGRVDAKTIDALVQPMRDALRPIRPGGRSLGQMVIACARQHLRQHPREIGGQNMGPWVRLYMTGKQGTDWPWCAGFACYILEQACRDLRIAMPFSRSVSSSKLAGMAKENGTFLAGPASSDREQVRPGCFFLTRGGPTGHKHTGLVVRPVGDTIHTIEGNTNDEGTHEGYEVCKRTRKAVNQDYVLV